MPVEHVLDGAGIQPAVALEVTEDPLAKCLLEVLDDLGSQLGGRVELDLAVVAFGEHAVGHGRVHVRMLVEERASPVEEGHGAEDWRPLALRGCACGRPC